MQCTALTINDDLKEVSCSDSYSCSYSCYENNNEFYLATEICHFGEREPLRQQRQRVVCALDNNCVYQYS